MAISEKLNQELFLEILKNIYNQAHETDGMTTYEIIEEIKRQINAAD